MNRDDKFFNYLSKKANFIILKISSFGKHRKVRIRLEKVIKKKILFKILISVKSKRLKFEIKDTNIYNFLALITVLNELNVDFNKIKTKFKTLELSKGRGKKYNISRYKRKFKLIDESYNANPSSVKNAIKNLTHD